MTALVWAANLLGWPVIQLGLSGAFLRLPVEWFKNDTWLTAPRRWERGGRLYRDCFAIRRWKALLPDGASWFGGFSKRRPGSRHGAHLARFLLETRRAELAHWSMVACLPLFFLWNPAWACWVMTLYALGANLPCILAQRYNRLVLLRVTAPSHCIRTHR
jgi:glycosyl-4,4'-diaponeurosporenoate acyltransferase